jgi:hypothetical protein
MTAPPVPIGLLSLIVIALMHTQRWREAPIFNKEHL